VPVEERIRHLTGYFRGQLDRIQALTLPGDTDAENNALGFYKKALLVTALDTLAGLRYPKANYPELNGQNQKRFISFVVESGAWPEGSLTSIPFLEKKNLRPGKLLDLVRQRLAQRQDNREFSVPLANIDLTTPELLKAASTEQEEKAVRENQHFVLLYRYRNYLVHESRVPGYAMEISEDEAPYYHGYLNDNRLYLCYPLAHFVKLVADGIAYLEGFLQAHQIDPYDFVSDTSAW